MKRIIRDALYSVRRHIINNLYNYVIILASGDLRKMTTSHDDIVGQKQANLAHASPVIMLSVW